MPANVSYISAFFNKDGVEGPRVTRGYIPCWIVGTNHKKSANFVGREDQVPSRYDAMGASGVTIATGVDLGQTDRGSLSAYGVSDELIDKLSRYIGKKRDAAIAELHKAPLTITSSEAAELDHAVHRGYLMRYVRPAYDKASKVHFDDLPEQAQAVVFSICYQHGCGGVKKNCPATWKWLTTQNWAEASEELRKRFHPPYPYINRRRIEGNLLRELL